ncbi:MAG: HAMP domain-containing sensor histidine kinase [Chloroflexota bacterium]
MVLVRNDIANPVGKLGHQVAPMTAPLALRETDRRVRDVLPAVIRQLPLGVAVVRADRSLAFQNDEFTRIIGAADVLRPMTQPDGSPFPDGDEPLEATLRTAVPIAGHDVAMRRTDETLVAVSLTMSPIVEPSGATPGAVLYVEDASTKAEDASLREAFVGVLSHELRTPITAIYGGAQLLRNDRVPAAARAGVIEDIAAEAEHLHRLVEDLLAVARIGSGMTADVDQPLPIVRLVADAARAEERRWPGRRVEIHADAGLPAARGDDAHVRQVLRNLLSNAVKFSPAQEPVVVELSADDETVRVVVLDRGKGFAPGTGSDAFQLFHRSPAVAARHSGTGIGLFVARSLVEAQGGRIWLRDRPGGGSEVGFCLRRYDTDEPDADAI